MGRQSEQGIPQEGPEGNDSKGREATCDMRHVAYKWRDSRGHASCCATCTPKLAVTRIAKPKQHWQEESNNDNRKRDEHKKTVIGSH
mmetsp:Transcript_10942/g.23851  ORF Transcript_10942/g.23851 Transcript_10942/m.23851 type:complete len:87 (-) Transcript_10942:662-922(-)